MVGQVTNPIPAASRRARRSLVLLIVLAVLALGSLSSALDATSSPLTGIRFAASGLILITALGLALRVTIAVEHARRRAHADAPDSARFVALPVARGRALRDPDQSRKARLPAGGKGAAGGPA